MRSQLLRSSTRPLIRRGIQSSPSGNGLRSPPNSMPCLISRRLSGSRDGYPSQKESSMRLSLHRDHVCCPCSTLPPPQLLPRNAVLPSLLLPLPPFRPRVLRLPLHHLLPLRRRTTQAHEKLRTLKLLRQPHPRPLLWVVFSQSSYLLYLLLIEMILFPLYRPYRRRYTRCDRS